VFSLACLLIFLTVSFKEQEFKILMKSSLSVFSLIDFAFGVFFMKDLPNNLKDFYGC
jgi:hypothetical protein